MEYSEGARLRDHTLIAAHFLRHVHLTSRILAQIATHDVYEYLLGKNAWVVKAPLVYARLRFAAAYVSGTIYAFGGEGTSLCLQGVCEDRGTPSVESFIDVHYPPVFVYQKA